MLFYRWVLAFRRSLLNGGYIVYHRQHWLPFFESEEILTQVIVSVRWTVEDGEAYSNWSKPLDKYARKHLLPTINSSCSVTVSYREITSPPKES
ncbi:MAG: hypothetical protein V7L22_23550 [Nostoc sp.]|uniref:hypothetical protein n=1 Tax=Nostoc sp. TaxID=1180 RepID=UPI002FF6A157